MKPLNIKNTSLSFLAVALIATPIAALAADFVSPKFDWSGAYVGVHAGALNQGGTLSLAPTGDSPPDNALNPNLGGTSFIAGLLGGYNWQITPNVVTGIEGDVGFGNSNSNVVSAKSSVPMNVWYADNTLSETINGHVRGRLGWASGSLLAYGSAGVAISNSKINVTGYCPPDQYSTSGSRTLVGYSIGAGADYAVTETAIVRLEYIYDGYGHQSEDVGSGAPNYWQNRQLNLTTQTFRAALIYKF